MSEWPMISAMHAWLHDCISEHIRSSTMQIQQLRYWSNKGWTGELMRNQWIYVNFEFNLIKNSSERMAKTIRSHPTSHILVSEPICWTTLIFSKSGPKMDLPFLHFPTSLYAKRPCPKGKKMRVDHPFILGFCRNVTFDILFTIMLSLFGQNPLS